MNRRKSFVISQTTRGLCVAFFAIMFATGAAGLAHAEQAVAGGVIDFTAGAPPVSPQELDKNRGAGLDSGEISASESDQLAVILWDELKPPKSGATVSFDGGLETNLTSNITGTMQ